ncbi:MAG: ferritin-like domain-containing protein, partial [Chloroflexota bacterium]|nr:ferritin-like domain-containing protein [Chloroflexota bacterium]
MFDIYASHPLAGPYTVRQTALSVARYHFIEAQMMRIAAGKLASLPEWEVKCLLGRHLWQDSLHADLLLHRLRDLRWPRTAPLHPGTARLELMALLDSAPTTTAYLLAIYQIIKPRLIAAYAAHSAAARSLADEPTVLLLRQILVDEQQQCWEGVALLESLPDRGDQDQISRWQRSVDDAYTGGGGFAPRGDAAPREVASHFEGQPTQLAPAVAARDARFRWEEAGSHTAAKDAADAAKLIAHRDADNEMHAAEVLGRNIYEQPRMPWEYHLDLVRQCWDEVRHAVLYQKYLEEAGGRLGDYPITEGNYAYRMALDFPHRLYDLHLRGERLGMHDLLRYREQAKADGDRRYALLNDFIHADEVPHVKNGRWLRWLLNEDDAAYARVERETMQLRA